MAKYKVLLIEDEAELLELIALQIDHPEIDVICCGSSLEAYEILKKQKVHLVVTDLTMPRLNGLDFIQRCRENITPLPTFYLMTGFLDKTESEMKALGVEKLFHKPEDMPKLIHSIQSFFD